MTEYIYEFTMGSDGVDCYIRRGEIVRCLDCKHWTQIIDHGARGTCDQWYTLNVTMGHNYCSRGERKETADGKTKVK